MSKIESSASTGRQFRLQRPEFESTLRQDSVKRAVVVSQYAGLRTALVRALYYGDRLFCEHGG